MEEDKTTEGDDLVQRHPRSHRLQRGVQMNLTKQIGFIYEQIGFIYEQSYSPGSSIIWEFLVKILKPENDGVLELVKNVSCNPNTVDLYLLESRASSSKLAWKLRKFH